MFSITNLLWRAVEQLDARLPVEQLLVDLVSRGQSDTARQMGGGNLHTTVLLTGLTSHNVLVTPGVQGVTVMTSQVTFV